MHARPGGGAGVAAIATRDLDNRKAPQAMFLLLRCLNPAANLCWPVVGCTGGGLEGSAGEWHRPVL